MPIYDRPVRLLMREMIDELAPEGGIVFTRKEALNWFRQHYPKVKEGTVGAHLLRFSTNSRSRHYYSPRADEAELFQLDGGRFRRYDPANDPPPLHGGEPGDSPDAEDDGGVEPSQFAYESDLRDFLARNMTLVEPGMQLYEDEEGITGVEFPVGGRFADLLGVDAQGRLVVIELKVSRGYDRVIGQLLRYMAWISQHQAEEGQGVRGMIIAREISEDLRLACSSIPDVELFEYELAVSLRRVAV
jgi:endonuclease